MNIDKSLSKKLKHTCADLSELACCKIVSFLSTDLKVCALKTVIILLQSNTDSSFKHHHFRTSMAFLFSINTESLFCFSWDWCAVKNGDNTRLLVLSNVCTEL